MSLSGRLLGALEGALEALGGLLEASEGALEALGAVLKPSWRLLDASCAKSRLFFDFGPASNGQNPSENHFSGRRKRVLRCGVGGVGGSGLKPSLKKAITRSKIIPNFEYAHDLPTWSGGSLEASPMPSTHVRNMGSR